MIQVFIGYFIFNKVKEFVCDLDIEKLIVKNIVFKNKKVVVRVVWKNEEMKEQIIFEVFSVVKFEVKYYVKDFECLLKVINLVVVIFFNNEVFYVQFIVVNFVKLGKVKVYSREEFCGF